MVPVGQVVAYVGPAGAKIEQPAPVAKSTPAPAAATQPTSTPAASTASSGRIKASPIAKKLAAKLGIDLANIKGSGPGGRIVQEDVEKFDATAQPAAVLTTAPIAPAGRISASPNARRIAQKLAVDIAQITGSGPGGRIIGADVEKFAATATTTAAATVLSLAPAPGQPQPGTEVPISKMRRAIGINLQHSAKETPHFNTTISIDMTRAMKLRQQLNQGKDKPQKVSVNDMVVKAAAIALKQYPAVNSRLQENTIVYLPDVNIGVATSVPEGLVVPVLTNADNRPWNDIALETKRITQEARNGKIIGMGKGGFTVSNLGMFGIDNFTAIINPPESAILAVGALQDQVIAVDGMIAIKPMMKVTLCSDHRIVDGALAAQFLQAVKLYLQEQIT